MFSDLYFKSLFSLDFTSSKLKSLYLRICNLGTDQPLLGNLGLEKKERKIIKGFESWHKQYFIIFFWLFWLTFF